MDFNAAWEREMFKNSMMVIIPAVALMLLAAGCKPVGQGAGSSAPATQADFSSPGAAQRAACANNLKQLGLGCKMYAAEHNGRFPDTLDAVYPEYHPDQNCYRCPGATRPPATSADAARLSDYEIVPGLTDKSPGKATVLVREKSTANHTPAGRNVLYVDGHVEFIAGVQ
jgi:prepilin-type processing-associated H-X9-DG protein